MGGDKSGEDSSQDLLATINKESGNKRKFSPDVSVETPIDESISPANEFHGHKMPTLNELGSSAVRPENVVEEEEDDDLPEFDWEDHMANHFQGLLTDSLLEIFQTAIKKVVECGYSEGVAGWAVLNSGLSRGSKDVVSNIVDGALALLKTEKECNIPKEPVYDGSRSSAEHFVVEMTNVVLKARPDLTKTNAMRCLLMSDMNLSRACLAEEGPMPSSSGGQSTREKAKATSDSSDKKQCQKLRTHNRRFASNRIDFSIESSKIYNTGKMHVYCTW